MDNKTAEYLKQINQEIERTVERIEEYRKELNKSADNELWIIAEFGTAKDAEALTKLATKWKVLQEQRQIFKSIFEIKE